MTSLLPVACQKTEMWNAFFYLFHFFTFVHTLKLNVICQYFNCEAHVGKISMLKCIGIDCYSKKNKTKQQFLPT